MNRFLSLVNFIFNCIVVLDSIFELYAILYWSPFMFLKIRDLLAESVISSNLHVDSPELFAGLVQEKVDNPLDFSRILKAAFNARGNDSSKLNVSHLYGLNLVLLNSLTYFLFFFLSFFCWYNLWSWLKKNCLMLNGAIFFSYLMLTLVDEIWSWVELVESNYILLDVLSSDFHPYFLNVRKTFKMHLQTYLSFIFLITPYYC